MSTSDEVQAQGCLALPRDQLRDVGMTAVPLADKALAGGGIGVMPGTDPGGKDVLSEVKVAGVRHVL